MRLRQNDQDKRVVADPTGLHERATTRVAPRGMRGKVLAVSQTAVTGVLGQPPLRDTTIRRSLLKDLLPGVLALVCAFPLAFLIYLISGALKGQPEKTVEVTGLLAAVLIALPPAA